MTSRRLTIALAGVLIAEAFALTGCTQEIPTASELRGHWYSADAGTIDLDDDGACRIANLPEHVIEGTEKGSTFLVNSSCSWHVGTLGGERASDGTPLITIDFAPGPVDGLYGAVLEVASSSRLVKTLDDPDLDERATWTKH